MQARVPAEKLQKAKDLVQSTLNKSTIARNELDTLLRFLCFAAKVVVPGRTFLRRLFNSKIGPARLFIHINSHIKADLLWWHHFLPLWNGIHIISPSRPLLRLWTDASGDFGIGAYILQGGQTTHTLPAEQVVSERYTTRLRAKHINEKEMTAILHAIWRWLPMCKGAHLLLYCDSFAVMSGVKKTSIRGGAMHPLRNIAMMAAIYDIEIEPHWLSTKENFLADWLSRGLFGKIADNYPNLQGISSNK